MSELDDAIQRWYNEVAAEAIRLIEAGVPPYDAMERARRMVSDNRRSKTFEKEQQTHE
jgi:hypothetical protein